jgi:hypothetical protein
VIGAFVLGVVSLGGFVAAEARVAHPMVPLGLFRSRNVSFPNGRSQTSVDVP